MMEKGVQNYKKYLNYANISACFRACFLQLAEIHAQKNRGLL